MPRLALAAVEIGDGQPARLDGVDDAWPGKQRDHAAGQRQATACIAADAAGAGHDNSGSFDRALGLQRPQSAMSARLMPSVNGQIGKPSP